MIKNKLFRIISLVLVASILLPVFSSTCLADEANDSGIRQTNASIIRELLSDIDPDGSYTFNCEYDSEGRISKILCRSEGVETTYRYIYSGSSYKREISVENIGELFSSQTTTELSGDDLKLTDPAIKRRIEQSKELWSQANGNNDAETKSRSHLEAQIARADACVLHPNSLFAQAHLEDGSLDTGTYFRRTLKTGDTGNDVFALQRALMYYDYLDVTKFSGEDYGTYEEMTKDAIESYQEEKLGKMSVTGIADQKVLQGLFKYTPRKRNELPTNIGMYNINVFKGKHDLVCVAVQGHVGALAPGSSTLREASIEHGSRRGNRGRADVVRVAGASKMVWEIKPDSLYGVKSGYPQVSTYVAASNLKDNISKWYCPLTYGSKIGPIPNLPWKDGNEIVISDYAIYNGTVQSFDGVVFYRMKKNDKELQPDTVSVPVPVPKQQEERKKSSLPEPSVVVGGLAATAGVAVLTFYVVKGIVAIVGSFFTGGASLVLLAC